MDVEELETNSVSELSFVARFASPAPTLGEPRQTGLGESSHPGGRIFMLKVFIQRNWVRSWPNEAHLTKEDIEELWELIDAVFPKPASTGENSSIVLL